jgi:hypothetical protein
MVGGTRTPHDHESDASGEVEEFNYLGSMIRNDARCTQEIKARIAMAKAAFNEEDSLHQQIRLRAKEETSEVLHLDIALYGVETWTLRKLDQKYVENSEMWRRTM